MRFSLLPPVLLTLLLAGCAHSGPRFERAASLERAAEDPWEKTNRQIYAMNRRADRILLQPATSVYRAVVPQAARRGVSTAYDNLNEPRNFVNAVAQGKIKSAFRAVDRLLVNGILGLGVADHATDLGLPTQRHDFGQTMAVYGVKSGPYLMLPFFGPSTLRDGVGFGVDFVNDPVRFGERRLFSSTVSLLEIGLTILDTRSQLAEQGGDRFLVDVADEYATIRSAWLQLRRNQLWDGNAPALEEEDEVEPYPDDLPVAAGEPASEPAPAPSPPPAPDSAPAPATPEG